MTGTMKAQLEAAFTFLPLIFRRCVNPKSRRYNLSSPAILNGYVYATDGRIVVRMAHVPAIVAAIAAARPPGSKFPRAADLSWCGPDLYEPEGHPIPPPVALPPCPECEGTGVASFVVCPKCCGKRAVKCHTCGVKVECKQCNGMGKIKGDDASGPCQSCKGLKVDISENVGQFISGGPLLSHKYLIMLREVAPEARIWISKVNPSRSAVRLVMAGGVEGLLMPVYSVICAAGDWNLNPEP